MSRRRFPLQFSFLRTPLAYPVAASVFAGVSLLAPLAAHAADSDGDGVSDENDQLPCDASASSLTFAPSENNFATVFFEDNWPARGDLDFNDVVVDYHYDIAKQSNGNATSLRAELYPRALGGFFRSGLALALPVQRAQVSSVTLLIGGVSVPVSLRNDETQAVLVIADDVRADLFAGAAGVLNAVEEDGGSGLVRGSDVELRFTFTSGVTLDAAASPFDLFIFRSDDYSHQIHLPQFSGTSQVDGSLFGTEEDGSAGQRFFVDTSGLPFALHVPSNVLYPREQFPIHTLYPDIAFFAASGGSTFANYFQTTVNTGAGFTPRANLAAQHQPQLIDASCVIPQPLDGDLDISTARRIDADIKSNGRTIADLVEFVVSSVGTDTITLSAAPSGLAIGDEVMLLNRQGTAADNGFVGVWTIRQVSGIVGNVVQLNRAIDVQLGSTIPVNTAEQVIRLVRVPHYGTVRIRSGGSLTATAWGGSVGGIVAFSADSVVVDSGGLIDVNSLGYRGGSGGPTSGTNGNANSAGIVGEGICFQSVRQKAQVCGGGGGGFGHKCGDGLTGDCGAGGGGGAHNANGGSGVASIAGNQGIGGTLYTDARPRLLLGAGGGGGGADVSNFAGDSGAGAAGQRGGGIVYINAPSLSNSGTVRANGNIGTNGSCSVSEQGGGGAGGGGTVALIGVGAGLGTVSVSGGSSAASCCRCGGAGGAGLQWSLSSNL